MLSFAFQKHERSPDLRPHAPFRKLSFGKIPPAFCRRHGGELPLGGLPVVETDHFFVGLNGKNVGMQLRCQNGGRVILVDDRFHPLRDVVIVEDRHAPAPAGDHDESPVDARTDRFKLHDPARLGGGDDPPETPGGVFHDVPVEQIAVAVRLVLRVKRADRLGGARKRGIVLVNKNLRDK